MWKVRKAATVNRTVKKFPNAELELRLLEALMFFCIVKDLAGD